MSLTKLFEQSNKEIQVEVVHGDITSEKSSSPANIVRKVTEIIKDYLQKYSLRKSDIAEIIQITDADGAFIPPESVVEDPNCRKSKYSLTEIKTSNPNGIRARNANKSKILQKLRQTKYIYTSIPYRIVYMSCNLDHVLFDALNCSDEDKEKNSFSFNKLYEDDLPGFWKFIETPQGKI